ncbi:hypothetical protein GCM10027294_43780 [Marinactinospora endophytica]
MSDPAGLIRVERAAEKLRILVDGVELPCAIDTTGVTQVTSSHAHPGVTLTLLAERVEVVDSLQDRIPDDRRAAARAYLESLAPGARQNG